MKKLITIFILLYCTSVFGQFEKLIGTWITPYDEVIKITDSNNNSEIFYSLSNGKQDLYISELLIKNDTLDFQSQYYSDKSHTDLYDLKIINLTDSFLIVQPVSELSRKYFNNQPVLKFTRQQYTIDKSIKLDKIIFHTTFCYGWCPTYHLQIDSNKQVKLFAEEVFKNCNLEKDTSEMGYYTGYISDSTYNKLVENIQTCNLQTIEFADRLGMDGSIQTIIIYYNGKRKYMQSMFPPTIADNLIDFLYNICKNNSFNKTTEKFIIEE